MVISIRAFFGAKVQQKCTFCDRTCLENVLYEVVLLSLLRILCSHHHNRETTDHGVLTRCSLGRRDHCIRECTKSRGGALVDNSRTPYAGHWAARIRRRFDWCVPWMRVILHSGWYIDILDLDIVPKLDAVKRELLRLFYPDLPSSQIHAGYHRGHRPMLGRFGLPDIVSIHHLHLHVIIYPFSLLKLFKYPAWFPLMWVSDEWLLKNIAKREESS